MSDAIVVALIGLAGSVVGSLLGILVAEKLTQYRLSQLEKKVELHNQLVDRTYHLEAQDELREEQIKVVNHRLADLEKAG